MVEQLTLNQLVRGSSPRSPITQSIEDINWIRKVFAEGAQQEFTKGCSMTERWTDESIDRFASAVATAVQSSNERLTRIEHLVESNNRFLQSFGQDVKQLTQNMNQLTQQMASTTSNANQDRMDVTTRLSAINRKVDAIASHLGVTQ
jgi:hypothetical protein